MFSSEVCLAAPRAASPRHGRQAECAGGPLGRLLKKTPLFSLISLKTRTSPIPKNFARARSPTPSLHLRGCRHHQSPYPAKTCENLPIPPTHLSKLTASNINFVQIPASNFILPILFPLPRSTTLATLAQRATVIDVAAMSVADGTFRGFVAASIFGEEPL